jgi:RHS repeat-associated protein
MTLTWDANNRVKQIGTTAYQYDPSGYRIQKAASLTNRYYLEGEHLEAIYDGNGALRDQYLRGTVIDEVVNGYHRDANNMMINSTYHHDALQSVLGQSAHDGQIQATQTYTAFGGSLSGTGTSNAAQKYTGREADVESGFYYYRARYYDPVIGRFVSEDPLGFNAGDVNFYAYVGNNPVNANDPSGHCPWCIGATIGGLAGGVSAYNAGARGWDLAGSVAVGALSGAVGTYSIGAITSTTALLSSTIAGGVGGSIGNLTGQLVTGTSVPDIKYDQVLAQGVIGALSSEFGFIYASTTSRVVASAVPALAASTGGAINTVANLFVPTSFGGIPLSTTGATTSSAANGGFVLYPNKSNTNQMQSVYSKH